MPTLAATVFDKTSVLAAKIETVFRQSRVDYSNTQPITTTYANDNLGLSQVLIADNGTTQTANLYGLDLLLQDDGAQTRTLLLTDGLGSARQEMAGSRLETTTTTYEPYGNLLAQTGTSGTTYCKRMLSLTCRART